MILTKKNVWLIKACRAQMTLLFIFFVLCADYKTLDSNWKK